MLGIIWCLLAVDIIIDHSVQDGLWHTRLPVWVRVPIWALPGLVAIAAAFWVKLEVAAFWGLFVGPFERFISFSAAAFGEPSASQFTGVLVYMTMVCFVVLVAAWPEPSFPPRPPQSPEQVRKDRAFLDRIRAKQARP